MPTSNRQYYSAISPSLRPCFRATPQKGNNCGVGVRRLRTTCHIRDSGFLGSQEPQNVLHRCLSSLSRCRSTCRCAWRDVDRSDGDLVLLYFLSARRRIARRCSYCASTCDLGFDTLMSLVFSVKADAITSAISEIH